MERPWFICVVNTRLRQKLAIVAEHASQRGHTTLQLFGRAILQTNFTPPQRLHSILIGAATMEYDNEDMYGTEDEDDDYYPEQDEEEEEEDESEGQKDYSEDEPEDDGAALRQHAD